MSETPTERQSPWRSGQMRHVQEIAAAEFVSAWERQREIESRLEQIRQLRDEVQGLRQQQEGNLLLVGELRFGAREMHSVVGAALEPDPDGRGSREPGTAMPRRPE